MFSLDDESVICFYSVPLVMPGMFFWRVRRYGTKCLIEGRELLFYRQRSKFVIIFSRGVLVDLERSIIIG